MDRFEYMEARLFEGETYLKRDKNVKIYDGDDKVCANKIEKNWMYY